MIALLTLLLGGTVGILIYTLATDDGDEAGEVATDTSSTTTTDPGEEQGDEPPTTPPATDAPGTTTRRNTGNQTAVGNGTFTGSYQSNQDRTTDEFEVADDWQIRWDVPAGTVVIQVIEAAGGDVVETIEAQGEGQRRFAEGGRYQVDIDTDGSEYSVVITDGP
ncbi:MAG TPA: hypothetical protein VNT56_08400 [Acidimicrobiales bacterium]|nr:hypothetical protein [Acidimicrobiales bacterium]